MSASFTFGFPYNRSFNSAGIDMDGDIIYDAFGRPFCVRSVATMRQLDKVDYEPKKIIFNDPATIVFWSDGTKTVVKCMPGETYNKYFGFLAALGKKIFSTNSHIHKIIENNSEAEENA